MHYYALSGWFSIIYYRLINSTAHLEHPTEHIVEFTGHILKIYCPFSHFQCQFQKESVWKSCHFQLGLAHYQSIWVVWVFVSMFDYIELFQSIQSVTSNTIFVGFVFFRFLFTTWLKDERMYRFFGVYIIKYFHSVSEVLPLS